MHGHGFVVSSYCHTGGCVAVAVLSDGAVAVRDNKLSDGPVLTFSSVEWEQFIAGVKDGEFDVA